MRHRKAGTALGRNSSHRRALLRNMVTSLLKHEQIETTSAKAKAVKPVAEKLITLAKRGDLHARRQALSYIQDKTVAHRLFDELKDRFADRQGGYLRVVRKGARRGDGASVSVVQLLPAEETQKKKKKRTTKHKSGAKTTKAESKPAAKRPKKAVSRKEEETGSKSQ